MGAIASGGVRVMNEEVLSYARISPQAIETVIVREQQELERRERAFRGSRPPLELTGRTVFVVDDGLATGSTMRAAVRALRQTAAEVIIAVPVAAAETCEEMHGEAHAIVCLRTPSPFQAVGLWYEDFAQTTDAEVHDLLGDSSGPAGSERRD